MKRFSKFMMGCIVMVAVLGASFLVIAQDTATPAPEATVDEVLTGETTPTDDITVDATPAVDATAVDSTVVDPALPDLETVTADPAAYIGQTITLEGVVQDLINVRAFVLGEGAALDNDQVLVINASGEEFDLRLTDGARFSLTGTVYASFADGGFTQVVAENVTMMGMNMTATPGAMATEDAMMEATAETSMMMDRTINLADMIIPDALFGFTIINLTDINNLQFIEMP